MELISIKNSGARKIINICGIKFQYLDRLSVLQRLLNVQYLHSQVFTKYKNCHAGQDIVLIATGPSLSKFEPIKDAIYIGVNRAFEYDKVKFDYIFIHDNSFPTAEYIDRLNNYSGNNVKKFYGICSDYGMLPCTISESNAIKGNAERYYLHSEKSKNIPTYNIASEAFFNSSSVVFPAIQFALWTNPKRIYLVGCDTTQNGYYNNNLKNVLKTKNIYRGWQKVKEFANVFYPETEIISINPVRLKGIFTDTYTNE